MKADIELDVTEPDVVTTLDGKGLLLRCQIVDQPSGGPRRSGKYIHLAMTPKMAMRLLANLQTAQAQHGYPPEPGGPISIAVPPKKDRQ